MKKFLSAMLALLMVVSVLSLAGCNKGNEGSDETENTEKTKTNAELFVEAYNQLELPEIYKGFIDFDMFTEANHIAFAIDKFKVNAPVGAGDAEIPTFPNMAFDFFKTGDKSFIVSGDMTLDDETIGGSFEIVDGERFYLSVPEATDLYLTAAWEDFIENSDADEDIDMLKSVYDSLFELIEDYESILFSDENLTSETVDVEVFGEKLSLNKLTLKLDIDMLFDFIKAMIEALPEELKAEVDKQLEDEAKTLDELFEELKKETDVAFDFEWSFYLDDENVKRCEIAAAMEAEGEKVDMNGYVDVLNTADTYKAEGEIKMAVGDEDLMILKGESEITLKDGKLSGESKIVPEIKIPEDSIDEEDTAATLAILESLEVSSEFEGEVTDEGFDIEIENELSMGGMAIKLPMTVKGEMTDDKLDLDMDAELSLMGAGFELGMTALIEKGADVKVGTYDADNAVTVDDDDKYEQFSEEVSDYVEGLEGFAEFFELLDDGEKAPDTEYPNDEESASTLFYIYNDDGEIYFLDDGTCWLTMPYDLVVDEASGTMSVMSSEDHPIVITLIDDERADVSGLEYNYELFNYDDSAEYYLSSPDSEYEFWLWPDDGLAKVELKYDYTMDDTTITIDGNTSRYTIDETTETITIGDKKYYYVSFSGEGYASTLFNIYNDIEDVYFYDDGTGWVSVYYDLVADETAGTFTLLADGEEVVVITLTGDETADISGINFNYDMYDYEDGNVEYYFYSDEITSEIYVYPYDDMATIDDPFTYIMDDTTITINDDKVMEYTLDEDAEIMILDGLEYDYYSYVE